MGRPRLHDERTGAALLEAAEGIVETDGPEALSVRRVADEVGTTSRAVYTVFGSKLGMVVALGSRAFDLLGAAVEALPVTDDPAADLVASGVGGCPTSAPHPPASPASLASSLARSRAASASRRSSSRLRVTPARTPRSGAGGAASGRKAVCPG